MDYTPDHDLRCKQFIRSVLAEGNALTQNRINKAIEAFELNLMIFMALLV